MNGIAVDWPAAHAALAEVTPRLTALLRSVTSPGAPALGSWTVAEVACHLSHGYDHVGALAAGELSPPLGRLWDLNQATQDWVRDDPERDPVRLAARIERSAARLLEATDPARGEGRETWLVQGSEVTRRTFACHILNEALVHGWDIAQAERAPWTIERRHAALVLMGFIVPVFQALDPATFVDQARAGGVAATYDLRLRGGGRTYWAFDRGRLTISAPSGRKVDCRLSADPSAMLLVAWGRRSQWPAIARGQLLAWGRRPWLGLRLRSLVRNP